MIFLPRVDLKGVLDRSKDSNGDFVRPNLADPYFMPDVTLHEDGTSEPTPEQGVLLAANGFVLVVLPVEHAPLAPEGHLSQAAIDAELKAASKRARPFVTRIEGGTQCGATGNWTPSPDGHYFDVKQVLHYREDAQHIAISLDAQLLLNLAKALNEGRDSIQGVTLVIDADRPNEPIYVYPVRDEMPWQRFGMLMPMHRDLCRAGEYLARFWSVPEGTKEE